MLKKLYYLLVIIFLVSSFSNVYSGEIYSKNLLDTIKPVIIHTPLSYVPKFTWPASLSDVVTDSSGIDSVWVRWRKNSSTVKKHFRLNNTSGNNYFNIFNSVNADVVPGDSIFYKIFAKDSSNNHNTDSTPQYHFLITSGFYCIIGTGTVPMGSTSGPFNTYWWGNRTQILYLANELSGCFGYPNSIQKIAFYVLEVGGQSMLGFNIRMQNTTLTSLSAFISSGWTTVYSSNYTISGTGWQNVILQTPFYWNGTSNLLIEICFGNTSYSTATTVLGTTMQNMERTEYHDLSTACAYTGFTSGYNQTARANICINCPFTEINPVINSIPNKYSLFQNYPNPFNPVTRIDFDILKKGFVSLKVYDVLGREVQMLVNEEKQAGSYSVDFNGSDLTSGVYFYKFETDGFTDVKRMVLIK